MKTHYTPISPGEILREEFLVPLGVSQNQLARDLDVTVSRIAEIIKGSREITADTALRLAQYFGTTPQLWLNLQNSYDLAKLRQGKWKAIVSRIRPLPAKAKAVLAS